jgi:hypothetical protein
LSSLIPPALLLFWSGIAATALTGLVAAPLVGERFASIALSPRVPVSGRALWQGLIAYPAAYALGFMALGEANLLTGVVLGAMHAALLALLALRTGGRELVRASVTRMLLLVAYGGVLGFAFVTP